MRMLWQGVDQRSSRTTGSVIMKSCDQPGQRTREVMHLSMLSRRGGRPGVGGGFDVTSLPVAGTFDHSSSPGGRDF